ncbi:D-2-hydroxyacid dehydrogenase [Dehalobacter sp. DCM]|uniref:D-2-hydroxyacid dehydrogenase n=1 Tax=Dehalobacter sp. DCM TaxID=2907827 RepID=UPI0030819AB2|nr:D-2-hydroxyacid dehydrogenase [Dehalobacter sp. DCM]
MKIVVLDGYTLNPGDISWNKLESLGDLTVYDRTTYDLNNDDAVIARIGNAEAVFTNKTPITQNVIEKATHLKFIGVLATGYNIVDVAAAVNKGITVTNIPAYGTESVGQMAIALLLEMCHHVGAHSESVKKGEWSSNPDWTYWQFPLIELSGKTMGIIGYGRIGQATGRIAQAMGMSILAVDTCQDASLEGPTMRYTDLDDLLRQSDVIVLHCPLFESTKAIINKETIAKMKPGVMIVNNSRGPLIVEADLAEALNSGKIAGAALDVVSTEPIRPDNVLLKAKNCIITPHISWASLEARQRLMSIAVRNLETFIAGAPENVITK